MEPPPASTPPSPPAATAQPSARLVWLFVAVMALAALLRIRLAIRSPLWFEEIYFLLVSRHSASGVVAVAAQDIHPPLVFLLRHAWARLGGEAPMWHKSLSIALSLASFPLAWRLFRRLFDARVALVATALLAVAYAMVRYGQEVGMYQLQWLLALIVVDAWTSWIDRGRARDAVLGVVASVLALYTHYAFLPVQALLLGWGLVALRRDPRRSAQLVGLHAVVLAGFLPQVPTFLHQLAREGTMRFASFPRPHEIADYVRKLCLSHTPLLIAFAPLALVPLLDRARRRAALLLWMLVVLPPLAIRVLPVSFPNEFLFAAPFWFALVAAGFDARPLRALRLAAAVALVALSARWCWQAPPFPEGVALSKTFERLRSLRAPGDLVLHAESHSLLFALYYDPAGRHRLLLGDGGTQYFDGGLAIPDSVKLTPAAWASEREAGGAWWAVSVDRARVARNELTRAGAEQVRAIAGAARGPHWVTPPVTLWEGLPAPGR